MLKILIAIGVTALVMIGLWYAYTEMLSRQNEAEKATALAAAGARAASDASGARPTG